MRIHEDKKGLRTIIFTLWVYHMTSSTFASIHNTKDEETCNAVISEWDSDLSHRECQSHAHAVCNRNFTSSIVNLVPYSKNDEIREQLLKCCGGCIEYSVINIIKDYTHFTTSSIRNSDFVYPVLGRYTAAVSLILSFIGPFFVIVILNFCSEHQAMRGSQTRRQESTSGGGRTQLCRLK